MALGKERLHTLNRGIRQPIQVSNRSGLLAERDSATPEINGPEFWREFGKFAVIGQHGIKRAIQSPRG